ncbi:MAG TPA: hypothetical protein DDW87_05245 [Firmicutes bacterium]|nr:hypothetical protein [Bacillota bacterium]
MIGLLVVEIAHRSSLERGSIPLLRVSNTQEALALLEQESVDLVVIDAPSLDETDIALIKEFEQSKRPSKIVIVSKDSDQVDRRLPPKIGIFGPKLCRLHEHDLFESLKTGTNRQIRESLERLFSEIRELDLDQTTTQVVTGGVLFLTYQILAELGYCPQKVYGPDFHPLERIVAAEGADELEEFFVALLERVGRVISDQCGNTNQTKIETICRYMQENYVSEISLSAIAKRYRMSPSYLSALFAKSMGQTFTDYLTECRISKAKEILKHTDKRIYEVAMEVGYRDPYYFSNRFKQITGSSPSEYRERVAR